MAHIKAFFAILGVVFALAACTPPKEAHFFPSSENDGPSEVDAGNPES